MPFIPHTEADIQSMLKAIGANSIDQLFDEIPTNLKTGRLENVPDGLNEMDITRLMRMRAAQDGSPLCFAGAGSYEHHIPAAVWEIVTRGEYYSAYTPYQAEASQGTLQLIYEFQSMMTRLTGLDVSNASLYDGASALAEAVLMAERVQKKTAAQRVLVPRSVHPAYRKVLRAILTTQKIAVIEIDFDQKTGLVSMDELTAFATQSFTALVIPQANYFGVLEEVDVLTNFAHAHGALAIALVNPIGLAALKAPGRWGDKGADIACGDGQPLGVPMASGGPYFGFMTCKNDLVRQMPGRIVGRTVDLDGREGFALTLQAREQHIRRAKATSNICTNQGLLVTAATIYMAITGPQGLRRVAYQSMQNTRALMAELVSIDGVECVFDGTYFHEIVLRVAKPAAQVIEALAALNIVGGVSLENDYAQLNNSILFCATETKTAEDIVRLGAAMRQVLA